MDAGRCIALTLVLVAAACGGDREAEEPAPTLPAELAAQLATEADAVAARLEAGNPCGAAEVATALQQRTIAALNRPGAVPDALKEDLGMGVADVVDRAQSACAAATPPHAPPPPPTPPPPPPVTTVAEEDDEDDERGKGRGKKKGHGKRKGND